MKKTFEEFVEQIEKENEEFLNLPKNKKKVRLAQDVLTRLKFDNFTPHRGRFYILEEAEDLVNTSAKSALNSYGLTFPICECCAKGALFLSYVGRVNNYDFTYCISNIDMYSKEERIIKELFSDVELDAIETAFEGVSYMRKLSHKEEERVLAWRKKLKQGNTSKGSTKILKAICNNIIKNDGEFVY